jgi:hypothetical protein
LHSTVLLKASYRAVPPDVLAAVVDGIGLLGALSGVDYTVTASGWAGV